MAKSETGHSAKMCALTCCACNMDLKKVQAVVKGSHFVCESCGHVAAKAKNLCDPVALK